MANFMDNTQSLSKIPFDNLTLAQSQQAVEITALMADASTTGAGMWGGWMGGEWGMTSIIPNMSGGGFARYHWLAQNKAFYKGDHWQNALGWVGPQPLPGDLQYFPTLYKIYRQFVAKNMIREVVHRVIGGVLGRDPFWNLVLKRPMTPDEEPTLEESAMVEDAVAAVSDWWNRREVLKNLQEAVGKSCYSGRGPLRLYVPEGLLVNGEVLRATTLQEALDYIHIDVPEPEQAAVIVDSATRARCGIYYAQNQRQVWENSGGTPYAELTYLDENRKTVTRSIDEDFDEAEAENNGDERQVLDLGGRLQQGEIVRPVMVTETVRSLQKLLNMALTMLSKNVVMGGFLERTLLDVQLPGKYIDEAQSDGTIIERFVPDPINVGAGAFNVFEGKEHIDENGNKTRATPQMHYQEPVDVTTFLETARATTQALLEEVHQDFVLMNTHATASGKSREMARQEFESDLRITAASVETCGRWLLETALAMAAEFMGEANRYDVLRVTFECRISAGERTALDRTEDRNQVAAGLLSRETAMGWNGIEDTTAELNKIQSESARFNLKAQYEEEAAGLLAGIPLDSQWRIAGVDEEEISERIAAIQEAKLLIPGVIAAEVAANVAASVPDTEIWASVLKLDPEKIRALQLTSMGDGFPAPPNGAPQVQSVSQ